MTGRTISISSVILRTAATAIAPKATWDRPSPMKEYRFSTSVTPRTEEQRAMKIPAMNAYCTNE